MLRFIRLHPWRLEIVPAIAFAMSVAAYVMYRLHNNAAVVPTGSDVDRQFGLMLLGSIMFVACFWLMALAMNHRWVMSEREKRFNWISVVMQTLILIKAAIAYQMSLWFTADPAHFSPTMWPLCGIVAGGLAIAVLMEATRRFVPGHEDPEPPLGEEQDSSSYADTEVDYGSAPLVVFLVVSSVLALVYYRDYVTFGVGLAAAVLIGSLSYRRVTLTREAVLLRWGPVEKRFAVSDITGCRAMRCQMFERPGPARVKVMALTSGRYLEMTTRDGKTHAIGMLRPAHACRMLEAFLAENRERPA